MSEDFQIKTTGRVLPCKSIENELVTSTLYLGPFEIVNITPCPQEDENERLQETVSVVYKIKLNWSFFNRLPRNMSEDTLRLARDLIEALLSQARRPQTD